MEVSIPCMCVCLENERGNCKINSNWDCKAKNYQNLNLVTLSPGFEEWDIAETSLCASSMKRR